MSAGATDPPRSPTVVALRDLPVAGLVRSADRRILEWNPAATALFGWSEEEVLGVVDSERIWPLHASEGDDWSASLDQQGPSRAVRSNRHKDGRWLRCEWYDTVLVRDGQRVVLSVVHDRTEREKLEQQLRVAQRREVVGTLVGGIAHDFNNLLTAMFASIGFLDDRLAQRAHLDVGEARSELGQLEEAAARAADLTRQLLMFLRDDRGRARPVHLNEVVEAVSTLLRRVGGSQVSFDLRLDPSLAPVEAVGGQLEQVVMNLCLNARDAMPEGGAIQVTTARVAEEGGDTVVLTVSDSGTGMTPDLQERIFEPFFTTKPTGQGTGLGLAVTAAIVERHGGRISVASSPGAGSRFTVVLPSTDRQARPTEPPLRAPTGTE
ncbi:MAG: ATP-binding protein, partial [Myxococcota bacterium]